ncbi:MAG TPA: carboxyl transferase domain-containing protein [Candidatus Koribacter sp.]|jgi:acetyl/propionyl-CoA carboxylase alpha subunit/acetyl-CoA carboxylase carboxyltransferase component
MDSRFRRIAIVNRGEPGMRLIHAVREYNQEYGTALRTIGLFTEPDRHSMFVREAGEAFCIGPAQTLDTVSKLMRSSYVDYDCLRHALIACKAEAAWVGWGFVAEHAQFADLCRELGIVFIGPGGDVMRLLGDKISSKRLAEKAQVPVAMWSGGPVETIDSAYEQGERVGYPLFIKATAGGGGRGMRQVSSSAELERAFVAARSEAFKAFGDPTVFIEQRIDGARHVEVQVIADEFGTVWPVGVRDCTIQRRQQKVMEEAPCPVLSREQDRRLCDDAVQLCKAADYVNVGTVEFLYLPASQRALFMEMNTRLQVEHPVTECTTGIDLVKLQILIAQGHRLVGSPPESRGHAIEVRLNAEDASNDFAPAPGVVERFRISTGPGVRVDTGVEEGDEIAPQFDSMIAKIIATGSTREEALARTHRALRQSVVVIRGGTSNRAFLMQLVSRPEIHAGNYDIGWLDGFAASGHLLADDLGHIALFQAAIDACDEEFAIETAQFYASALRGRPEVRTELGHTVELRYARHPYSLRVYRLGLREYRIEVDSATFYVEIERLRKYENSLYFAGRTYRTVCIEQGLTYRIEFDGVGHRVDRDDGGVLRAQSPSVVVSIAVKPGDRVEAGDRVAVLEAMKMEMQVSAPFAGVVRKVMATPNVQVGSGDPLLQIDPATAVEHAPLSPRMQFAALAAGCEMPSLQPLGSLRQMLLGFDVKPEIANAPDRAPVTDGSRTENENGVLSIFLDICSLFRNTPRFAKNVPGESPSTESCLISYLHAAGSEGQNLPADFLDALRRALLHYGLHSLEHTLSLDEALLRIYKSHQRIERQIPAIMRILQRRLDTKDSGSHPADPQFRSLLDRMVAVTRAPFPSLSDLVRELRYRCFEQPVFEEVRSRIFRTAEECLDVIAAAPHSTEALEKKLWLVDCPQLLAGLFSRRMPAAPSHLKQVMLEVLTSRYYCVRRLADFRLVTLDHISAVRTAFDDAGGKTHIVSIHSDITSAKQTLALLNELLPEFATSDRVFVDLLITDDSSLGHDVLKQQLDTLILNAHFVRRVQRIVVALPGAGGTPGRPTIEYFTYEQAPSGHSEVELFRGVHPATGDRLHLWRLTNFNIERLPSIEDIFVLHVVAKSNPKDERLFAVAEVRDVTPIRDASGRVVGLPNLERMFTEAVAAIRSVQSQRSLRNRLYWNRIFLYIWPPLALTADEMDGIIHRLAPATAGIGLEQVVVRARIPNPRTGEMRDTIIRVSAPGDAGILTTFRPTAKLLPMKPLSAYDQKVVKMRQRGLLYPYEIVELLTPPSDGTRSDLPPGEFTEYDLDATVSLISVTRPYGENTANIVVGVVRNFTDRYPEGMNRVIVLGDPSRDLGAIAEPECRRINAALDLAESMKIPLEWFAVSAGAKISMESGVENMDWIARVLKRLVEFTQAGGEINIVVNGINVGAQPYWNAEATMLMHTRGILIMTPKGAMVLTGKRALDYSGSVSASDNYGIGGYDRIMGVNGQAQYFARDIDEACEILMRHYEHTYKAPGEAFPRRATSSDPIERDVCVYPVQDSSNGFNTIGDIFSDVTNPGRKHSFDIRNVMLAVSDQDYPPLERFSGLRGAETAVVWDAHLGGYPICMIGIESKPLARFGFAPADGPDQWTAGTLFPMSSKKVARALNAASNNRPVVILANLSGFDGSPESMRRLQLEYGAEIGRAAVNFKGPIVFCVISRYHGGAYVVFSRALNPGIEIVALEGTYASVIGGAPAAAVVFAGEVEARARKDARVADLSTRLKAAEGSEKKQLEAEWNVLFQQVHSEKLGEVAAEFDSIHSVQRALEVGALHSILPARNLRSFLVDAVQRGINRRAPLEKVESQTYAADTVVLAGMR